jgi:hypothetical protein
MWLLLRMHVLVILVRHIKIAKITYEENSKEHVSIQEKP